MPYASVYDAELVYTISTILADLPRYSPFQNTPHSNKRLRIPQQEQYTGLIRDVKSTHSVPSVIVDVGSLVRLPEVHVFVGQLNREPHIVCTHNISYTVRQ